MKICTKILPLVTLFLVGATSFAQSVPDAQAKFVTELKNSALELYNKTPDASLRLGEVCKLIDKNTDLQKMIDFSLGRFKKKFSETQILEFNQGFRAMLANIFDLAFQNLQNGEVFIDPNSVPISAKPEDGRVVNVSVHGGRSTTRLQFFVSDKTLLFDASLNGIRVMLAKRSEFERFINSAERAAPGSGPEALVAELKSGNTPCP